MFNANVVNMQVIGYNLYNINDISIEEKNFKNIR